MKKQFLLLLTALFVAVVSAKADTTPSGYWSDYRATDWASNYDESNEFYISTAEQLAQFAYMVNNSNKRFAGKTVRLMADIDLIDHLWVPIGFIEWRAFAGTFDGQGHTISGVRFGSNSFSTTYDVFCGIFGVNAANATVRNVNVANSTFEAVYNVSGVVAYNKGTVENCSVGSDVVVRSTADPGSNKAMRFAGIVASNTGTVRGCVSHANLSDHVDKYRTFIGGIVGHNFGRVENCVYLGNVETLGYKADDAYSENKNGRLGPIVGVSVQSGTDQASYGDNYFTQSATEFASLDAGKAGASLAYTISCSTTDVSLSFDTPTHGVVLNEKCYAPNGQTVQFRVVPDDFFKSVESVTATANSNSTSLSATNGKYTVTVGNADITIVVSLKEGTGPAGSGTDVDPFIIKSTAHWDALATAISGGNPNINKDGVSFFRLDADITVSTMMGTADHPFESTFDGNGHKLTVNYTTTEDYCAPFRYVRNAEIENLTVDGTIQSSGHYAGGLMGHTEGTSEGTSKILNCVVKTNIESTGSGQEVYDGGFIGYVTSSSVNIVGSVFEGTITSSSNTCFGGFVGKIESAGASSTAAVTFTNSIFDPRGVSVTNTSGSDPFVIADVLSSVSIGTGSFAFYTKQLGTAQNGGSLGKVSAYMPTGTPTPYGRIDKYSDGLRYNGVFYSTDHEGFYDDMDNMPLIGYYLNRGAVNAKFNGRKLYKDGAWNTLCLPFNLTAEQLSTAKATVGHPFYGATIWEMDVTGWYNASNERSDAYSTGNYCYQTAYEDGPDVLYLYFQNATSIEAGKPYLMKWAKPSGYDADPNAFDISDPVFENVTIKASLNTTESDDGSVLFVPTFSPVVLEKGNWQNLYVGAGNMLKYPSSSKNFTLNSFRGYFQLMAGDEPASNPLARSINFVSNIGDDNETTGIVDNKHEPITNNHSLFESVAMHWYTLDGRKLDGKPTKKGLYIHNGNKLVIK